MYPFHADENFDYFRHRNRRRAQSPDGKFCGKEGGEAEPQRQIYAWQLDNARPSAAARTQSTKRTGRRRQSGHDTLTMNAKVSNSYRAKNSGRQD